MDKMHQFYGLFFTFLWTFCNAKVGFQKDSGMDTVFPPLLSEPRSGIPLGHLRPLGWQRKPDSELRYENKVLPPKKFYNEYIEKKIPMVFHKIFDNKTLPAMSKWTDDYLKSQFGYLEIHATVKKEQAHAKGKKLKLKDFLKEYKYEDWYLSTIVPQVMMDDLSLPMFLQCGTISKHLMESEIWMSSGGTGSMLHYHGNHNLHCVMDGRKDFIIIDPKYSSNFEMEERHPHSGSGYSKLDMEMINMFKHEKIGHTPWDFVTVLAGDCIYIPAGYLHQVRSYGRSLSYNIHWVPTPKVTFEGCDEKKLKPSVKLSEAAFVWTYLNGDKQLSNIRLNAESMKHYLTIWMRDQDKFYLDSFKAVYSEALSEVKKPRPARDVFSLLDNKKKGYITRKELENMDKKKLNAVATAFNRVYIRHDEL